MIRISRCSKMTSNGIKFSLYFNLLFITQILVNNEIITLNNGENYTCVTTGEDVEQLITLDPPTTNSLRRQNKLDFQWLEDNWVDQRLTYLVPVDSRWNEFETVWSSEIFVEIFSFGNMATFSVCTTDKDNLEITINEKFYSIPNPSRTLKKSCQWDHYKVNLSEIAYHNDEINYNLYLTHQYDTPKAKPVLEKNLWMKNEPLRVLVRSGNNRKIFWKKHELAVKMYYDRSRNLTASIVFEHFGKLCVSFQAHIGENMRLKVELQSGKRTVGRTVVERIHTDKSRYLVWQTVEMEIEAFGANKLTFWAERANFTSQNYLIVDGFKFCPRNFDCYKTTAVSEQHVCKPLEYRKQQEKVQTQKSCGISGYFGKYCNISCSTVLGKDYQDCRLHEICYSTNNKCSCAFGCSGPSCQKILNVVKATEQNIYLDWSNFKCDHGHLWFKIEYEVVQNKMCKTPNVSRKILPAITQTSATIVKEFPVASISLSTFNGQITKTIDKIDVHYEFLKEIESSEMPLRIAISSDLSVNITFPNCTKIKDNLQYRLKFICTSPWCLNKTTFGTNISYLDVRGQNEKTFVQNNLEYFTRYIPIVEAQRNGGNLTRKNYPEIETPAGKPGSVKDVSVYCSNESTLWVKWLVPHPPRGPTSYFLIIFDKIGGQKILKSANLRCGRWPNFICEELGNLSALTHYTIEVFENISGLNGTVTTTAGFTPQTGPPKILGLHWLADNRTVLKFSYPNHCSIDKFLVTVKSVEGKKTYNLTKDPSEIYEFEFRMNYLTNYNVSISSKNTSYDSDQIQATLFPQTEIISRSQPLLEYCVDSGCFLSIPKPDRFVDSNNTYQLVIVKQRNITEQEVLNTVQTHSTTKNYSILDSKGIILKTKVTNIDNNRIEIQTAQNPKQKISALDTNFQTYLKISNKSQIFPLTNVTIEVKKGKSTITIVLIFMAAVLLALSLVFLTYFKLKKRMKSDNVKQDFFADEQELLELPSRNYNIAEATKIKVSDLDFYIKSVTAKDLQHNKIVDQFNSLQEYFVYKSTEVALKEDNVAKNRYRNSVPYDSTRVVLKTIVSDSDYINASFINGFDRPNAYIAAQSPKFSTVKDFWRMIWQQNVQTIVMATDFLENNKRKCVEYFPQNFKRKILECGGVTIELKKLESAEFVTLILLQVSYLGEIRNLRHFQLKWNPERDVYLFSDSLVALLKKLNGGQMEKLEPILVHCSSGGSRTAIVILCDLALEMAAKTGSVNFYKLAKKLREQRPNMLPAVEQYILAYLTVSEYFLKEDLLKVPEQNDLSNLVSNEIDKIQCFCLYDRIVQNFFFSNLKNHYLECYSCFEIYSYERLRKFMTIKLPTDDKSLYIFWNIILKERIKCILFLNKPKLKITKRLVLPYLKTIITLTRITSLKVGYFDSTNYIYNVVENGDKVDGGEITVIQLHGWTSKKLLPHSTVNLFHVNEQLIQITENHETVLIACHDGSTACGLFASLSYLIEKIKKESDVDVCGAVRTVKRSGLNFIKNPEVQIKFLHEAAEQFRENFDPYHTKLE